MPRKVGIIGVGMAKFVLATKETREESQLTFQSIKPSLEMAGLNIEDIDATVYSSGDAFLGTHRVQRTLDAFGQYFNKPNFHTFTGGSSGITVMKEAYNYIASGLYDIVLVFGGNEFSRVVVGQQALNTASPALFEKSFGVGALQMGAWHSAGYMLSYGATEDDYAFLAAKSFAAGAKNPNAQVRDGFSKDDVLNSRMLAWPLRRLEICPLSSGSTAMILASEERARELSDTPIWIKAIGSISDTYLTGYREYGRYSCLKILAERLYSKAGIKNPRKEIDVAELFNPFAPLELLEYEAFGFCEEGKAVQLLRDGVTSMGGDIPVNTTGGMLCTNSGVASQLAKIGDMALQLMGKFEGLKVKDPKVALTHNCGGNCWQSHGAVILVR